jgi:hypothetical protein
MGSIGAVNDRESAIRASSRSLSDLLDRDREARDWLTAPGDLPDFPPALKRAYDEREASGTFKEWPFDEATFARVVTISSTVVAAILARVLLPPFDI